MPIGKNDMIRIHYRCERTKTPELQLWGFLSVFGKVDISRKRKLYIDISKRNFYNNERVKNNCRQKQQ